VETREDGNPVHYSRALAMEAETYARLGDFNRAFAAKANIEKVYDPKKHSAEISKAYGSDRTAQLISISCSWYWYRGDAAQSLQVCDYVLTELMPLMDAGNVHNAFVMVVPIVWVYKEAGKSSEAFEIFNQFVLEPFKQHFTDGAFTFFMPLYEPIKCLLDLTANQYSISLEKLEEYLEWALVDENLCLPSIMNSSHYLGRLPNSVTAEICLVLSRRLNKEDMRYKRLICSGFHLAHKTVEIATKKKMTTALLPTQLILDELKLLYNMI